MHEYRTTKMRKCRCMKFLCIISGCPAGARNWHISYFSMLLHSKKPVYLGFSGKQNCSDTCVPEQFFPRCQNDRTKFCIACFHGKKLPGSSTRRSFARFGTFSPRNSSRRAFSGCGAFLDRWGSFSLQGRFPRW